MDTSDDPMTIMAAAAVYTATQAGRGGGGGGGIGTQQAKTTAEPTAQPSEAAKRNRRLAASTLTKGFAEPTLGTPGLLGA